MKKIIQIQTFTRENDRVAVRIPLTEFNLCEGRWEMCIPSVSVSLQDTVNDIYCIRTSISKLATTSAEGYVKNNLPLITFHLAGQSGDKKVFSNPVSEWFPVTDPDNFIEFLVGYEVNISSTKITSQNIFVKAMVIFKRTD